MRMFPQVSCSYEAFRVAADFCLQLSQGPIIMRYSAEDTTFVIENEAGQAAAFPVPAETRISISVAALSYNRGDHLVQRV